MADINHKNEELNYKNDFSEMFVKLIDAMVDYEHFSRETLVDALCRLARSFRLTKVVTEFYKSMMDEKDGEGETLCDFDGGWRISGQLTVYSCSSMASKSDRGTGFEK